MAGGLAFGPDTSYSRSIMTDKTNRLRAAYTAALAHVRANPASIAALAAAADAQAAWQASLEADLA